MHCAIYKSLKKQDTYLYVATKDDFSRLPNALLQLLGEPVHVMDLELNPARKLAHENVLVVMHNLATQGWHLQLPPQQQWLGPH